MARVSVRLIVLVLLGLLAVPTLGLAAPRSYRPTWHYTPTSPFLHYGGVPGDHLYRYGYRLWAAPTLTSVPSVGIIGAAARDRLFEGDDRGTPGGAPSALSPRRDRRAAGLSVLGLSALSPMRKAGTQKRSRSAGATPTQT
jgi:hypothetical protein